MDKKSVKEIAISSALYSLGSIIGPILVIGVPAYLIDKWLDIYPWLTISAIFIAFIVTNILLFKKIGKINKMMESYRDEIVAEKMKEAEIKKK